MKIWNLVDFKYKNENTQEIDQNDPLTVKWRFICMAGMAIFIYPINCTKNLAAIRYISLIILVIVLYTVVVAVVQAPEYYDHNSGQSDYQVYYLNAPFHIKWFQGWATMMLSYNCQITLFYVRGELMHKTPERLRKISRTLVLVLFSFYLLISVTGYLSLGEINVPKIFTLRKKFGKL